MYDGHTKGIPSMSNPSIEVVKECLRIKMDNNVHLIKKDSILGYAEKGNDLAWYLQIYTNIAKEEFIMKFQVGYVIRGVLYPYTESIIYEENVKEEYRNCRKLLDSILLPEDPEVVEVSSNMLRN